MANFDNDCFRDMMDRMFGDFAMKLKDTAKPTDSVVGTCDVVTQGDGHEVVQGGGGDMGGNAGGVVDADASVDVASGSGSDGVARNSGVGRKCVGLADVMAAYNDMPKMACDPAFYEVVAVMQKHGLCSHSLFYYAALLALCEERQCLPSMSARFDKDEMWRRAYMLLFAKNHLNPLVKEIMSCDIEPTFESTKRLDDKMVRLQNGEKVSPIVSDDEDSHDESDDEDAYHPVAFVRDREAMLESDGVDKDGCVVILSDDEQEPEPELESGLELGPEPEPESGPEPELDGAATEDLDATLEYVSGMGDGEEDDAVDASAQLDTTDAIVTRSDEGVGDAPVDSDICGKRDIPDVDGVISTSTVCDAHVDAGGAKVMELEDGELASDSEDEEIVDTKDNGYYPDTPDSSGFEMHDGGHAVPESPDISEGYASGDAVCGAEEGAEEPLCKRRKH